MESEDVRHGQSRLRWTASVVIGVLGAAVLAAVVPATSASAAGPAGCSGLTARVYQADKLSGASLVTTNAHDYSSAIDRLEYSAARGVTMLASTKKKTGSVAILRMFNAHTQSFRWVVEGGLNQRAAGLSGFRVQQREFYALPAGGAGCIRVYRYSRGTVDQLVQAGAREPGLRATGWTRREGLFWVAPTRNSSRPVPKSAPGSRLTVIRGDLIASRSGQVINGVDVRGSIIVRAANVTIRNSVVRGGTNAAARRYWPLVDARAGAAHLLIQDTVIAESTPSAWNASGIGGSNFTARRVKILGQVDSVNITGSNVTVEDSVLGRNVYYPNHWQSQKSGGTHNDNVQVLRGDNVTIRGNIMTDSHGLGVIAAPEWGSVRNLLVENNFIDNGECSSKFTTKGGNASSMTIRNNVFGGHQRSWKCYIVTAGGVAAKVSGNVMSNGSRPTSFARISATRSRTSVAVTPGQL